MRITDHWVRRLFASEVELEAWGHRPSLPSITISWPFVSLAASSSRGMIASATSSARINLG